MPTPKQTRFHYKRCRKAFYQLLTALNDAHNAGVIDYGKKKDERGVWVDALPSVCKAVFEAKDNFRRATQEQLADAMEAELMSELGRKVW
jgi:predicted RNA-binding protein YlxR (DUF448 family)